VNQDAPGLIGQVARWIDSCSVHPAPVLSTAAAIVTVATIVGRAYSCQGARAPLYVVGIAKSGVGKDTGRRCAAGLLEAAGLGRRIGADDIASSSGIITKLRECPVQMFPLDEFGRMLEAYTSKNAGNHERQIITTLMKMWSSCGDTYHGKAYADGKLSQKIVEPAVVLYGTTTPDVFFRALRGADVVDGVLSRILLVECEHGQQNPVRPTGRPVDPPVELVEAAKRIAIGGQGGNLSSVESSDLRSACLDLELSAEAQVGLDAIGASIRPRLSEPGAELWVRAREQALRLALVAAVGCEAERVGRPHLEWAWRFVRWSVARCVAIVRTRVADTEEGQCALLVLALLERGEALQSEITRACWRHQRRVRQDALQALLDSGQIEKSVVQSRGRAALAYRLAEPDDDAEAAPWLAEPTVTLGELVPGLVGA
jgi:hypothetical protein